MILATSLMKLRRAMKNRAFLLLLLSDRAGVKLEAKRKLLDALGSNTPERVPRLMGGSREVWRAEELRDAVRRNISCPRDRH